MKLNEKILNVLADISENIGNIKEYRKNKHSLLNYMYKKGMIDDLDIESAIDAGIRSEARTYFSIIKMNDKDGGYYPDDISHPEFIAYCIKQGEFSKEEISRIIFDGENSEEFCRLYGRKNLVSKLREKILNYKESINEETVPFISVDWCYDGPCTVD